MREASILRKIHVLPSTAGRGCNGGARRTLCATHTIRDLDYHLSDTRGDALASAATRVPMITADVEFDAQAALASVDRRMIKPFSMRDLVAAVSTLLPGADPGI